LCITAKSAADWQLWVKSGKAQTEQMMSAFQPIATEQRTQLYVGFVPQADVRD
jgi:hypothetical protein